MRLRTVIADDEPLALGLLGDLLADDPRVDVVAQCASGREVQAVLAQTAVDLLVLDVQMPGLGGVELARALAGPDAPMVIFATAHAEYAVDAFDAEAVDYVLKPLDEVRLGQAVGRALARRAGRGEGAAPADDEIRIPIRQSGRTLLLSAADIVRAESSGDYLLIHTTARTHTVRMTITALAERLPPGFHRIHRSAIVNAAHVGEVISQPKGDALVRTADGAEIRSSRTHRAAIEAIIARHG